MYGEILDSSTELVDSYNKYMNVGLNNNSGSDKTKQIKWFLSHDDHLTFNVKREHYPKDVVIREWEYLLKNNRESHLLFYPFDFDTTWESEEIKNINKTYR